MQRRCYDHTDGGSCDTDSVSRYREGVYTELPEEALSRSEYERYYSENPAPRECSRSQNYGRRRRDFETPSSLSVKAFLSPVDKVTGKSMGFKDGSIAISFRRKNKTVTCQVEPFECYLTASGVRYISIGVGIANTPVFEVVNPVLVEHLGKSDWGYVSLLDEVDPFRIYISRDLTVTANKGDRIYVSGFCFNYITSID